MRLVTTPESRLELSRALRLMSEALDILDELGAPGDIGGILDLAVARLAKLLDRKDPFATAPRNLLPSSSGNSAWFGPGEPAS